MGEDRVEWPTVVLLVVTYAVWAVAVSWLAAWSMPAAILVAAIAIAQHSSLQHEALHGHPFDSQTLNAALVRPGLSLVIPYGRFRDTHLAHHQDSRLTDPFDDPECNYLTEAHWNALPWAGKWLYRFNGTLMGRMLIGPALGTVSFIACDLRGMTPAIARSWGAHVAASVPVVALVWMSPMSIGAYLCAAYLGLSLLKIRTYLEHRAHAASRARSVIIEDRGPLALLFLNNNFHAVHHMHPGVAWYKLPALYHARRARFLACNEGYVYRSYGSIFARYLWRRKDPVAHPLWHRTRDKADA